MDDNSKQIYIGITTNDSKTRYRNHLKSVRNEKYKHETELSKQVWNLKKENRVHEVPLWYSKIQPKPLYYSQDVQAFWIPVFAEQVSRPSGKESEYHRDELPLGR